MASQTDLDQGGSFRQYVRRFLGPSVGWVNSPDDNVLDVTAGGTTTAALGTTLIKVNYNGAVTIQLPSALSGPISAGVLPGKFLELPMTIVDTGGFAASHNITILPFGSELIMGLASITISVAYGAYVLLPRPTAGGWVQQ
jgi:hypothetical protein